MNAPLNRHLATSLSQFNALEHLMIDSFVFYSFGDLHHLICALPHLRELYLASGQLSPRASTILGSDVMSHPRQPLVFVLCTFTALSPIYRPRLLRG